MRLALLSPVHGQSIDHIARQLENYRTFLAPFELRHYLHVSLESSESLQRELLTYAQRHNHDIMFTHRRRTTWRHCTANAFHELIQTATLHDSKYQSVFIHTDADLLFSSKLKKIIRSRAITCGSKRFQPNSKWKWNQLAMQDPRLKRFIKETANHNPNNLFKGRVCGCSMPKSIFLQFSEIYLKYFSDNYFDFTPKSQWPLTEVAIPSILNFITPENTPFLPPLITAPKTKNASTRLIKQELRKKSSFRMKKITKLSDQTTLKYLSKLQQKAQRKNQ